MVARDSEAGIFPSNLLIAASSRGITEWFLILKPLGTISGVTDAQGVSSGALSLAFSDQNKHNLLQRNSSQIIWRLCDQTSCFCPSHRGGTEEKKPLHTKEESIPNLVMLYQILIVISLFRLIQQDSEKIYLCVGRVPPNEI